MKARGFVSLSVLLGLAGGPLIFLATAVGTHAQTGSLPQSSVLAAVTETFGPPAPTPTPTPSEAPTPTPTPQPTATPTPSPKPTATPTPKLTPTPTPPPVTGSQLDGWFSQYASQYSIDRGLLWRIARCESTLKTNAKNGPYGGLFQFHSGTWSKVRSSMNLDPNPDLRFNAEEAIRTAAFLVSIRGSSAWPHCGK